MAEETKSSVEASLQSASENDSSKGATAEEASLQPASENASTEAVAEEAKSIMEDSLQSAAENDLAKAAAEEAKSFVEESFQSAAENDPTKAAAEQAKSFVEEGFQSAAENDSTKEAPVREDGATNNGIVNLDEAALSSTREEVVTLQEVEEVVTLQEVEEVVTLQEVIEAQEQLEEEAVDLLGGESGNVCTYPQGYKPRQPLYSCKDCTKEGVHAGICYGCSINCHDGHDLVELYTKRNFCCDCGNSKFKNPCKLYEEKKSENERNAYNHNFDGVYCTCDKPYTGDEDMFQCCICEDWFHLEHLADGPSPQNIDSAEEIICGRCAEKLHFLRVYTDDNYVKESLNEGECALEKLSRTAPKTSVGALCFRSFTWRDRLCKCRSCLNLYEDMNVTFITDVADCVEEFVKNNRNSSEPKLVVGNGDRMVVETVGREQAIRLFAGFQEMKEKVAATVKRAVDEGREVRKEDISTAFEELQADRKRRRLAETSSF